MTGEELQAARAALGKLWGLDRPLNATELGRALRMGGREPGLAVRRYERGDTEVSGPVSVAIEMMLAGAQPPDSLDIILRGRASHDASSAQYASFGAWLLAQTERSDPVGDLAREARHDAQFAWDTATLASARARVSARTGYAGVQALRRAAFEFTGDHRAIEGSDGDQA